MVEEVWVESSPFEMAVKFRLQRVPLSFSVCKESCEKEMAARNPGGEKHAKNVRVLPPGFHATMFLWSH